MFTSVHSCIHRNDIHCKWRNRNQVCKNQTKLTENNQNMALLLFYILFNKNFFKRFFFECPLPSQEYVSCYHIVRFCVCWCLYFWSSSVFPLFRFFPIILDVFPSVLVCDSDLLPLNRFMIIKQRYTIIIILL